MVNRERLCCLPCQYLLIVHTIMNPLEAGNLLFLETIRKPISFLYVQECFDFGIIVITTHIRIKSVIVVIGSILFVFVSFSHPNLWKFFSFF